MEILSINSRRENHGAHWGLAVISGLFFMLICADTLLAVSLEPELGAEVEKLAWTEKMAVIVLLKDGVDLDAITRGSQTKAQRRRTVIEALRTKAQVTQAALLDELTLTPGVEGVRRYWIINGIALRASKGAILALAARPEVLMVIKDRTVTIPPVLPALPEAIQQTAEWNVARIGAPEVWTSGVRGAGAVVANIDTGVFKDHPDLIGQWRGGGNSWFDAVNGLPVPYDDNGHGTHTMGTIVGGNSGGTDIGVAPEAQWIACKGLNADGAGFASGLLACMEWVMDPDGNAATDDAADAVNNSWGTAPVGCFRLFEPAVNAWLAAGIFPIFSAGNSGPRFFTGEVPGVYAASFAVGATNINDVIAAFSSRGPSPCTEKSVFPNVSAPGVSVRSAWPDGGYRILSGTSMAAPHVSGCTALMLSARRRPLLEVLRRAVPFAETLLSLTAVDRGRLGPDQVYGWGRLNCLESVNRWK